MLSYQVGLGLAFGIHVLLYSVHARSNGSDETISQEPLLLEYAIRTKILCRLIFVCMIRKVSKLYPQLKDHGNVKTALFVCY